MLVLGIVNRDEEHIELGYINLVAKGEREPRTYAVYHCGTAANWFDGCIGCVTRLITSSRVS